jgi:hypothetical protein
MPTPRVDAPRDDNREPTVIGVSKVDMETPVPIAVNPTTGAVIVEVSP